MGCVVVVCFAEGAEWGGILLGVDLVKLKGKVIYWLKVVLEYT